MNRHDASVKEIQKQVRSLKEPASFSTGAHSNTLRSPKGAAIDISALGRILEIGPDYVIVEPRVTFKELCHATLKMGLIPPVVPEFATITVGGAIQGAALESSSHIHGQVSDTTLEYELILGNGEKITATPTHNSDLFHGLSGSYGTLALLTKIKLRLIPAKPYVALTYERLPINQLFIRLQAPTTDFIEAIALNPHEGILITGTPTNTPTTLYRQNRYYHSWFIDHIQTATSDTMRTEEYLFRLDRGAFWMGCYTLSPSMLLHKICPKKAPPPLPFRLAFNSLYSSKQLYKKLHSVPKQVIEKHFFIHDFYTPTETAQKAFDSFTTQTGIFPVWLCPIKGATTPQLLSPHFGHPSYINIGLYGIPTSSTPTPTLSAALEQELHAYGGRKMLYSHTYFDRSEFNKMYDDTAYMALREKFFAQNAFPHIHNKIAIC